MGQANSAIFHSELSGVPLTARGKVRDIYDLGDVLAFVATDRLSAFDHVLGDPIPDKGKVLCQLSEFWFSRFESIVPNHVITTDIDAFPEQLKPHADQLAGRTTLVRPLDRGEIREGYWADLVVFDLETIADKATFFEPHQHAEGIHQVIVNGDFVVEDGVILYSLPGSVITSRRGGAPISE